MRCFAFPMALLLALYLASLSAQRASAASWPDTVKGYELTEEAAKANAVKEAILKVSEYLGNLQPPIREWKPDETYVRKWVMMGPGAADEDIHDDALKIVYKTWTLKLRPPTKSELDELYTKNREALTVRLERERLERSRERLAQTGWGFAGIVGLLTLTVAGARVKGAFKKT